MSSPIPEQISYERWRRTAVIAWAVVGISFISLGLLYLIYNLSSVLQPFIFAGAIVYILRPSVDYFERAGLKRIMAIFLVYILVVLIITLILLFVIPIVITEAQLAVKLIPSYIEQGQNLFHYYQNEIARFSIPAGAMDTVNTVSTQLQKSIISFFSKLPQKMLNIFGGLFNILLAPVIAFYLLKDMKKIRSGTISLVPASKQEEFGVILGKIDTVLGGFIRGQMTVALIVGVLCAIGLSILRIDFALLIGIFAGFSNLIPYMGPIFGAIPAVFIAAVKFGFARTAAVVAMFAFVQLLDNILITPNVMRHHVGLPPVLVIFSLLTGGVLLGLLGMLLAIPTVAAGKAIIEYLLEKRTAQ